MKRTVLVLKGTIDEVIAQLNNITVEEFEGMKQQTVELKKGA